MKHENVKIALLVEIERHRAEMTAIKGLALAIGVTEAEFFALGMEIVTDLGGAIVFVQTEPRSLNS